MKRLISAVALILILVVAAPTIAALPANFILQSDGWHAPNKDPGATLDYSIDYTAWLAGDTISTSTWTYGTGITGAGNTLNAANTIATTWLTGGTAGQTYTITNKITTNATRVQVQSFKITVNPN